MSMLRNFFNSITQTFARRPQLELAGLQMPVPAAGGSSQPLLDLFGESLWFAVPKKKVSRSRKRMKTTVQKKIAPKNNIVVDGRTGEITLQHKLPFRWKDYLPEESVSPFCWDDFLPTAKAKICKTDPIQKRGRDQFLRKKTR
uniref:Uncharacterized protein n=1 Tax=Leptocylindrus danicus TaxID=163516 RepID=A0A7S2LLE3_9STRA|mmetsp:Transcript_7150/g.10686  ORF Transcript_7150/g.10686 Transcript_7150/m.10686 type:complete len:143 (+) Transcript_7150:116-544(+)